MASRGLLSIPLLLAIMVVVLDFVLRLLIFRVSMPLAYHIILFIIVLVSSGAVVAVANKLGGAIMFGGLAVVVALLFGLVPIELIAILTAVLYYAVVGFLVAFLTPRVSRGTGVR